MGVCACVRVPGEFPAVRNRWDPTKPGLYTQRLMRAGGNEVPPAFDLIRALHTDTVIFMHYNTTALVSVHRHTFFLLSEPLSELHWYRRRGVNFGVPLGSLLHYSFSKACLTSYIHPSWSFSLFCICSLTPLSVKSTVWLRYRQQPDNFKLLKWTFSGHWNDHMEHNTKRVFIVQYMYVRNHWSDSIRSVAVRT